MKKEGKKEIYDFIIIGAGPSGLAAAIYAARLGMKTLCLGASTGSEMPIGGVVTTTKLIENYPGFESISGAELAEKIRKQAESYEIVAIKKEKADEISGKAGKFSVKTLKGEYEGKTILFATGTRWRKIEVPGAKEFENKGVAYCALCDAPLFKNKTVAVIGGSNSAAKNALVLAEYAKKVYIIYRGEKMRADPANLKKIQGNEKIEIITKTNITKISGDKVVRSVVLDREHKKNKELEVSGVFGALGSVPNSELAGKLGAKLNEKGEIEINRNSETSIEGVFAAGDVVNKTFKQVINGVAEGCTAAHSAFEYLKAG